MQHDAHNICLFGVDLSAFQTALIDFKMFGDIGNHSFTAVFSSLSHFFTPEGRSGAVTNLAGMDLAFAWQCVENTLQKGKP